MSQFTREYRRQKRVLKNCQNFNSSLECGQDIFLIQKRLEWWKFFFSPVYFYGFLFICTSAAPQRPAHGTVSSQVATHLRTDRVCRVLGRSWIWTQDYWFAVRCATNLQSEWWKLFLLNLQVQSHQIMDLFMFYKTRSALFLGQLLVF